MGIINPWESKTRATLREVFVMPQWAEPYSSSLVCVSFIHSVCRQNSVSAEN